MFPMRTAAVSAVKLQKCFVDDRRNRSWLNSDFWVNFKLTSRESRVQNCTSLVFTHFALFECFVLITTSTSSTSSGAPTSDPRVGGHYAAAGTPEDLRVWVSYARLGKWQVISCNTFSLRGQISLLERKRFYANEWQIRLNHKTN